MPTPNHQQIAQVQETFALVVPIADAAAMFYGKLFEIAPETKPLFKGDLAEQGRKLMTTLGVITRGLDDLGELVPVAAALARRHVAYGVQPEHYEPVGEALLWTLEQGLGDQYTTEVAASWRAAYETLAAAMIGAAYDDVAS